MNTRHFLCGRSLPIRWLCCGTRVMIPAGCAVLAAQPAAVPRASRSTAAGKEIPHF